MAKDFINESLDLLDRECRDRLIEVPGDDPMHVKLWRERLYAQYCTPVLTDDEHCARILTTVDARLRSRITLHYRPAQGAAPDEYGRWTSDGRMFIRPGAPSRMLMTVAHECAHMVTQITAGLPLYTRLSDTAHEIIAESTAFVVLRALGIDALRHSTAYLANTYLAGEMAPGCLREAIAVIAERTLALFTSAEGAH